jgi:hypothetical protein
LLDRAGASLLAESADIVLRKARNASASARVLASQWHEQSVLDPPGAEATALKLDEELSRAEPVLRECPRLDSNQRPAD